MSLVKSVGGWGIIFIGTAFLLLGYVLSLPNPLPVGQTTTYVLGSQLKDIGFMLVVAGFAGWIIMSLPKASRLV